MAIFEHVSWAGIVMVVCGSIRHALYPLAPANVTAAFVDIADCPLGFSYAQYLAAIREALTKDEDLAELTAHDHSDAVLRKFLGLLEDRIAAHLGAGARHVS
jgi:hypothetical protein